MRGITWADPEGGGRGPGPPWKITSFMGFCKEKAIGPPHPCKKLDPPPPGKCSTPTGTVANNSFL